MKKRIISLFAAAAMLISLFNFNVMAATDLTVSYFNATRTAVTVDFANTVADLTEIQSNDVALYKYENYTKTQVTDFSVNVTKNSLVVTPTELLSEDAIYKLDLGTGITDGTSYVAEGETTGWFKVTELYFDDFSDETDDSQANWYDSGKFTGEKWQSTNNGQYLSLKKSALTSAGVTDDDLAEYTIEFDATMGSRQDWNHAFYISAKSSVDGYAAYQSGYDAYSFSIPGYEAQSGKTVELTLVQ